MRGSDARVTAGVEDTFAAVILTDTVVLVASFTENLENLADSLRLTDPVASNNDDVKDISVRCRLGWFAHLNLLSSRWCQPAALAACGHPGNY